MKKEYFSIPNLMGYFRILVIPIFLYLYYNAITSIDYFRAFFLLALSLLTDLVDGWVARRFNMITDFGKALDPVADKLTQCALAIAVTFHYPLMRFCLLLFVCKEIYMGIMGLYLKKKYNVWNGAQWYGKICTVIIDVCIFFLLLFRNLSDMTANALMLIMVICMCISFAKYISFHLSIIKEQEAIVS